MAHQRVIGKDNQMPWHLPADLRHFKAVTLGKPVIMGRKTYESIGKALPGRRNIVISRDVTLSYEDAEVVHSLADALKKVTEPYKQWQPPTEVMIIGGGSIYQEALPLADRLYLTFIDLNVDGDTHFPAWRGDDWEIVEREAHEADEKNKYGYQFVTLEKVQVLQKSDA